MINDFKFDNYPGISFSYPEFEILKMPEDLKVFEVATRTCYKSEDKIKEGSDMKLLETILSKNHTAMTEFIDDLVVRMKTNRGVTHEIVRMRLCSFAQESSRYVKYDNVNFIIPWWLSSEELKIIDTEDKALFIGSCNDVGKQYKRRTEIGWPAEKARGCLSCDVAATINMKANIREWMHVFGLRCDSPAHPDMRVLMCGILTAISWKSDIFKTFIRYQSDLYADVEWFNSNYFLFESGNNKYIIVNNRDLL